MLRKRSKTLNDVTVLNPELNEQLLFHGTRQQFVEPIYSQRGFDWRLAGRCLCRREVVTQRISYAFICVLFYFIQKFSTQRKCCVLGTSSGTRYGKGNYFARDASYSKKFTDVSRTMFVARVLVGDFAAGKPDDVKPPPKNSADPFGETYDSCVNDVNDPAIYVTFEFGQSYPAYLIQYYAADKQAI